MYHTLKIGDRFFDIVKINLNFKILKGTLARSKWYTSRQVLISGIIYCLLKIRQIHIE